MGTFSGGPQPGTENRLDDLKDLLKQSGNQTNWIIILTFITLLIGVVQILIMKGIV